LLLWAFCTEAAYGLLVLPLNSSALLADDPVMSTQALIALVIGVVLALVLLRRHGELVTVPATGSSAQATTVEAALAAGRNALAAGRKIEAIKLYRQEHGVGLVEAKEAIEELQRRAPAQ
jgi:hypothetical protein